MLAAHGTVITAFVVGNWLDANPSWGKRLVDAGHEVANHTYTHPSFLALSRDAMLDEIVRCRDVLTRTAGTAGTFFRPSGTDDGTVAPPDAVLQVAAEAGYPTVLGFDVDPFDYQDPGADAVAAAHARGGEARIDREPALRPRGNRRRDARDPRRAGPTRPHARHRVEAARVIDAARRTVTRRR